MKKNDENTFPYVIYCDMDGVLVDLFDNGVYLETKSPKIRKNLQKIIKMHWKWSEDHPDPDIQEALEWIRDLLDDNRQFWANLRPLPGILPFWEYLNSLGTVKVLSHPWDEASAQGKIDWINQFLSPRPKNEDIFLPLDGKKEIWAQNDAKPCILIDDFTLYTEKWEENGGIAILHTSIEETIKALEKIKLINIEKVEK
tara:strand:- start:129 stop:725 length:597 start_codon:yes stop_codon:yes gene_type:complete